MGRDGSTEPASCTGIHVHHRLPGGQPRGGSTGSPSTCARPGHGAPPSPSTPSSSPGARRTCATPRATSSKSSGPTGPTIPSSSHRARRRTAPRRRTSRWDRRPSPPHHGVRPELHAVQVELAAVVGLVVHPPQHVVDRRLVGADVQRLRALPRGPVCDMLVAAHPSTRLGRQVRGRDEVSRRPVRLRAGVVPGEPCHPSVVERWVVGSTVTRGASSCSQARRQSGHFSPLPCQRSIQFRSTTNSARGRRAPCADRARSRWVVPRLHSPVRGYPISTVSVHSGQCVLPCRRPRRYVATSRKGVASFSLS